MLIQRITIWPFFFPHLCWCPQKSALVMKQSGDHGLASKKNKDYSPLSANKSIVVIVIQKLFVRPPRQGKRKDLGDSSVLGLCIVTAVLLSVVTSKCSCTDECERPRKAMTARSATPGCPYQAGDALSSPGAQWCPAAVPTAGRACCTAGTPSSPPAT